MFSCIYLSDKDLIREREQYGNGASREADNPVPHVNQASDLHIGMMLSVNLYKYLLFANDEETLCFDAYIYQTKT